MISENIIKQDFIVNELKKDMDNIYLAQLAIARKNIYLEGKELKLTIRKGKKIGIRSGELLKSLENPDYVIRAEGSKFIVSAGIVKHIRFLDMKRIGNRMIYNRQVWGILYNNSLKNIRYRYGNEIANVVHDALRMAFPDEHGTIGKSFGEMYKKVKER